MGLGKAVVIAALGGRCLQVQDEYLDILGCGQIGDLGRVHLGARKGVVVSNGAGIGDQKQDAGPVAGPVQRLDGLLDAGKGILVECVGGDSGLLGLVQGCFKCGPLVAVAQRRQHIADIAKAGRFFRAVAVGHQPESDPVGLTGAFDAVVNVLDRLPGAIDVGLHRYGGIDHEGDGRFQLNVARRQPGPGIDGGHLEELHPFVKFH